jgi:hypothetical protein
LNFFGKVLGLKVSGGPKHAPNVIVTAYIDGASMPYSIETKTVDEQTLFFTNNLSHTSHYAEIYVSKFEMIGSE